MMHFARLSQWQSKDEERRLKGMQGGIEGQSSLRLGMLIGVYKGQHAHFLWTELDPPMMLAGPSTLELQCCEMPHIIVRLLTVL